MTSLQEVHFGEVFTHLGLLIDEVAACLPSGRGFDKATRKLGNDPVYREVSGGRFRLPGIQSAPSIMLHDKLDNLSRYVGPYSDSVKAFRYGISNIFEDSPQLPRPGFGHFVVPVMIPSAGRAGLVYLRAEAPEPGSSSTLHIEELTQDPQLISEDYFGQIAHVLLNTLYYTHTWPWPVDFNTALTSYAYRLAFRNHITGGRSVGAAVLAIYAIAYLQAILGVEIRTVVTSRPGTVLTGEVDLEGYVRPVGQLEEKITRCVDELGDDVQVIVPGDQPLPSHLEKRIPRLVYVRTAEELLTAVLSPGSPDGLPEARQRLFRRLKTPQKESLKGHLKDGIPDTVYDDPRLGRSARPTPKAGGVYFLGNGWGHVINMAISLEPVSITAHSKELVLVVLDGSDLMEKHWQRRNGVSRMASVLYEIASSIDPAMQDLVFGFFSHGALYPVDRTKPALDLESMLSELREEHNLQSKGAFYRYVLQELQHAYMDRSKRTIIVSDSYIPDLNDIEDVVTRFYLDSSRMRWSQEDGAEGVPLEEEAASDRRVISRYFVRAFGTFQNIEVDTGRQMPLEWQPNTGILTKISDNFRLSFEGLRTRQQRIDVRFVNTYPQSVHVRGALLSDVANSVPFSFPTVLRPDSVIFDSKTQTGSLEANDLERWRNICNGQCPDPNCSIHTVHLVHEREMALGSVAVFNGLQNRHGGVLLLAECKPEWWFFQNGCKVNNVSFVRLDSARRLHYSLDGSRLYPVEIVENGVGRVVSGSTTYYLCVL